MYSKFFSVLIVILIAKSCLSDGPNKDITKQLFNEVKEAFTGSQAIQVTKKALRVAETVLSKVALVAEIAASIMDLVKDSDEAVEQAKKEIEESFGHVETQLDFVVEKLDELKKVIQDVFAQSRLEKKYLTVYNLQGFIEIFRITPNKLNKETLAKSCTDNSMFEYMVFLKTEMVGGNERSVLAQMTRDGDRKKFASRIQFILLSILEATYNYGICYSALFGNQLERQQYKTTINYQMQYFSEVKKQVEEVYEKEDKRMEADWLRFAEIDVKNYLATHTNEEQQEFANGLLEFLENKYFWLQFVVVSFGAAQEDSEYYVYIQEHGFLVTYKDRHVYVGDVAQKVEAPNKESEILEYLKRTKYLDDPTKGVVQYVEEKSKDLYSKIVAHDPYTNLVILQATVKYAVAKSDDVDVEELTIGYTTQGWNLFYWFKRTVDLYSSNEKCKSIHAATLIFASCYEMKIIASKYRTEIAN